MNKRIIIQELKRRKGKLGAKGVKKIGLFGSYLKGTQKRGSDIDFLISLEEKNLGENYFEVLFYLGNVFGRKIDLIVDKALRKELNYVRKEAEYVEI